MGASFLKRGPSWRMRFRKKGYKELSINFHTLEEAQFWANNHYNSWLENPQKYEEWTVKNRQSIKKKGIFHRLVNLK
jgi:hypothetical protein